ncbi:MAG: hypothetical protein MJ234_02695 [bacterium]|nr:hypothetical protein [bacterium]
MDSYDISINSSDSEETKELKRKILSLQAQLEIEKNISKSLRGGGMLKTEPIDLYPGEQIDFVLSILEQAKEKCPPDSRPLDILNSILSQNKSVGRGRKILMELEKIFGHGDNFTEADISDLKSLGFTYISSKKHPKLKFMDKYLFVLSSSPSDSRRGNRNKLSEICKCIALSLKI